MATRLFPSIWLDEYDSHAAWQEQAADFEAMRSVFDEMDDRLTWSHRPTEINAWCAVCNAVKPMSMAWYFGRFAGGNIHPAWAEMAACSSCGFNSRMRALFALIDRLSFPPSAKVYLSEQVTTPYHRYKALFPNLIGSEYLGPEATPGCETPVDGKTIRHEDICNLSFSDGGLDLVVTQDVFEHVFDYKRAFSECYRVLKSKGGCLAFTIPFQSQQEKTELRASIRPDGSIEHLFPPEHHGNPLGGGSLCFQRFGWDILDSLREVGFSHATAHLYHGPWQGHFGFPFFIFTACKGRWKNRSTAWQKQWKQRLKTGLKRVRDFVRSNGLGKS